MDASFWFNTNDLRWSIVNVEGSDYTFQIKYCFSFFEDLIVSANSVEPDEMPHYAAFHQGLHCLLKFTFRSY